MWVSVVKVFIAGGGLFNKVCERVGYDFYRLDSYWEIKNRTQGNFHKYKDFILDSGVFTFLNTRSPEGVDWDKYAYEYAQFVKRHGIKNYVEIDLDKHLGLDGVSRLTKYLTKEVGYAPMPVWHIGRGWDGWLQAVREYKYVCFGAFLTDGLPRSKFGYIPKFLDEARKQGTKVHGLGFTSMDGLKKYKFHSVDSSSWSFGDRVGVIDVFNGTEIVKIKKPENMRIKNRLDFAEHSIKEWIKFQKYADNYL